MRCLLNMSEEILNTSIQTVNGSPLSLPVSNANPLFIVGPNGAGKSGLLHSLYIKNAEKAVRVAAHRQMFLEYDSAPFSPAEKNQKEENRKGWDRMPDARWKELFPAERAGLIITNIIDKDNALAREVRDTLAAGDEHSAKRLAARLPPLGVINELFDSSGIPIELSIENNGAISAKKRGGEAYSIMSLSDGERAALLIAGTVLTAENKSLVLIDEPERHLHTSIVTPLLLQLFSYRPDCSFVISTHELSMPVSCPNSKTVLVRDSYTQNGVISRWDLDILEPGAEIDDSTKEAIIGSRRKILFIEGNESSLDKPLYEILFPGVSIFPRSTCGDVEHAVASIRDASKINWVQPYGIVDQDQLSDAKKENLATKGVFALSVYSVEGLYYNWTLVEMVAARQLSVIGGDITQILTKAHHDFLSTISSNVDRLAARMTEQVVKDQISLGMPDWKKIQAGGNVDISVNAQNYYAEEKQNIQNLIASNEIDKIIIRYPIRETQALTAIASALQFKSRLQYEAAVRKLLAEDAAAKNLLLNHFGTLPDAIGTRSSVAM